MGYIYVFEFPNGKRYVGQSKNPEKRCKPCFYRGKVREAMDQFGFVNVKRYNWEVPDSQMDDLERFLISVYRSDNAEFGYNTQTGGKNGFTFSSDRHPMYGKHHTLEAKDKISNSLIGKNESEETRKKKSASHKGKKKSDITRKKMSEAKKLWWAKKKGLA